jgi:hypothetical protein
MTEDELNSIVIEQLARFELPLTPISRVEGKLTADLVGDDSQDYFYIEAKCRDRGDTLEAIAGNISIGDHVQLNPEAIYHRNARSSVIEDGVRQLECSSAEKPRSFRLLWLHCSSNDPLTDRFQLEGTLCGSMHFIDRLCLDDGVLLCYFFTESAFFRHRRNLDGAFICDNEGWFLLLNSHSPRYEALRTCSFIRKLGECCWDPISMEASGKVLIADCDINRRDSAAVLAYVNGKYSRDLVQSKVERYEIIMRVS